VNEAKNARVAKAALDAAERTQKHLHSLHHCLVRSDVMRYHHNGLVQEMLDDDRPDAFNNVKKVRFMAYIAFWYTALAGVIERYEELRDKGAVPAEPAIDSLLTEEFKSVVKPFRNSVAHCSDFDDRRTIALLDHEARVTDQAAAIADAFHTYFKVHKRAKA
jgi:hypothetical protein